jgi:hypothetical protein
MGMANVLVLEFWSAVLFGAWGIWLTVTFRMWGNRPITRTKYRWVFFYVPMVLSLALLWCADMTAWGVYVFIAGGILCWSLKPLEEFLFGKTGDALQGVHQIASGNRERRLGGSRGATFGRIKRPGPLLDRRRSGGAR